MNNTNPSGVSSQNNVKRTKKILRFYVILSAFVLFGLSCFLLSPLYVYLSSDFLLQGNFIAKIINFVNNVSYVVVYAVCFSAFIYSVYRMGTRSSVPLVLIYCTALLLRYLSNVAVQTVMDGSLPFIDELSTILLAYVLDVATAFAVLLIAHLCIGRSNKKIRYLPFDKLFSSSNPLQKSAFLVGILLASIKIITRVIYDIGYGAPINVLDLLRMMVFYLSDVLICAVTYLLSLLVLLSVDKKNNLPL